MVWIKYAGGMAVFLGMCLAQSQAGLEFAKTHLEFNAKAGDTQVEIIFQFINRGTEGIEITKIQTSCECITARLDKKRYAPGESGEIKTWFVFGERGGERFKQLMLATDDRINPVHRLSFLVRIPEYLQVEPAAVFWSMGAPVSMQTLTVKIPETVPIARSLKIAGKHPRLQLKLNEKQRGRAYELQMEPRNLDERFRDEIVLEASFPGIGVKRYKVYAYVK
ncbi:MAG: DUF1573 domain-containing protein [Verrucomicrobiales bacterium]|jgi:hypothetical protein|nr:DUF1573 domain-containing protein [Verrucomicrobiales bacterium]